MELDLERLRQAIDSEVKQTHFSGVVAIKIDSEVALVQAYGLADRSHRIANTLETRFNLASGTKFLTALGIDRIISRELRHTFLTPAVHAATQGPHTFYGHGIWMHREPDAIPAYYIVGLDAGVSFVSKWTHDGARMVTVMSNTTHGALPMRRAIDPFLW